MRFERHDVREEVPSREREVLDNEVECIVGIFDARDGDISDLGRGGDGE